MSKMNELALKGEEETRLKKERISSFRGELSEAMKEFFAENPDTVKYVTWTQYVPAFNDGEPCTFTLGELEFSPTPSFLKILKEINILDKIFWVSDHDDGDDDEDEDDIEKLLSLGSAEPEEREKLPDAVLKVIVALEQIQDILNNNEDALEEVFGSDARVTITENEDIAVDEYDCGY